MTKIVRITAKRDGFRRAGMVHPGRETDHAAESISPAQLAALKAEPMLVVHELDLPKLPAPDTQTGADDGGKKGDKKDKK